MSCSLFSAFSPVPGRPQICAAEQIIWDEAHKPPPIVDEPGVPHGPNWPTPHEVDMPDAFMDPDIENYFVVSFSSHLALLPFRFFGCQKQRNAAVKQMTGSELLALKTKPARLFTLDMLIFRRLTLRRRQSG